MLARRLVQARQRLLPGHARRSRTSPVAGPTTTATCYANEVSVPLVVGRLGRARRTPALAEQPLGERRHRRPREAGQAPRRTSSSRSRASGFLSANDTVRLYVSRPDPRYGLVPNLVGSSVDGAHRGCASCERAADDHVRRRARPAIVLEQSLQPGRRVAGQGLRVSAGRGPRARPSYVPLIDVAPRSARPPS